jgi:hypothetical protein
MKTAAIKIVRLYLCNNVTGAVYTLNGAKCSMLIGKNPYGRAFTHVTEAIIAERLGVSLAVVAPEAAASFISAAGYTASVWRNPRKPETRVYVKEGRKDRGYLAFDGEKSEWNIEAGMAWGDAKKFAGVAGIQF